MLASEDVDAVDEYTRLCLATAWRANVGDTLPEPADAARLWSVVERDPPSYGVCPALIEAILDGPGGLERLDAEMLQGPIEPLWQVAKYVTARLWQENGDADRALAAVRRRAVHPDWMAVTPAYLRLEGHLAAMVGDTTGAIAAYRRYLTLRAAPDSVAMVQVDSVRGAVEGLHGEPGGPS